MHSYIPQSRLLSTGWTLLGWSIRYNSGGENLDLWCSSRNSKVLSEFITLVSITFQKPRVLSSR